MFNWNRLCAFQTPHSCENSGFCWREIFQRKNIHEVSGNVIRLLAAWMANSRWREGADSGSGGQFWKTARPRLRWEPWGCGRLLSLSPSLSVARALCRESKWFMSSPSQNPHTQHIWNESTIKGGQAKPIHTLFATWSKLLHKALLLKASAGYSSSVTIVTLQILDTDIDDGEGDHL